MIENFNWAKNEKDKDSIQKLANSLSDKLEAKDDSPSLKALDKDDQEYIKSRFLKTNEDNLPNDYAQKLIIDGPIAYEKMQELYNQGERTQEIYKNDKDTLENDLEDLYRILSIMHEDMLQKSKERNSLQEEINALRQKTGVYKGFNLNKLNRNDIDKKADQEKLKDLEKKHKEISEELETGSKEHNKLIKIYEEKSNKYRDVHGGFEGIDPESN